jgi:hypothetical protein
MKYPLQMILPGYYKVLHTRYYIHTRYYTKALQGTTRYHQVPQDETNPAVLLYCRAYFSRTLCTVRNNGHQKTMQTPMLRPYFIGPSQKNIIQIQISKESSSGSDPKFGSQVLMNYTFTRVCTELTILSLTLFFRF